MRFINLLESLKNLDCPSKSERHKQPIVYDKPYLYLFLQVGPVGDNPVEWSILESNQKGELTHQEKCATFGSFTLSV
jgi:hypothetical protein